MTENNPQAATRSMKMRQRVQVLPCITVKTRSINVTTEILTRTSAMIARISELRNIWEHRQRYVNLGISAQVTLGRQPEPRTKGP